MEKHRKATTNSWEDMTDVFGAVTVGDRISGGHDRCLRSRDSGR